MSDEPLIRVTPKDPADAERAKRVERYFNWLLAPKQDEWELEWLHRMGLVHWTCELPPSMYFCSECQMTYPKGWSDEEQLAEAEENFPGLVGSGHEAVVCDDCYRKIMRLPPREDVS